MPNATDAIDRVETTTIKGDVGENGEVIRVKMVKITASLLLVVLGALVCIYK